MSRRPIPSVCWRRRSPGRWADGAPGAQHRWPGGYQRPRLTLAADDPPDEEAERKIQAEADGHAARSRGGPGPGPAHPQRGPGRGGGAAGRQPGIGQDEFVSKVHTALAGAYRAGWGGAGDQEAVTELVEPV